MSPSLEIEPRLAEESVRAFLRGRPDEPEYDREREGVYGVPDPEQRERAFDALHARWFSKLGLAEPIRRVLDEQGALLAALRRVRAGAAISGRQEGAELFVAGDGGKSVAIRIRPGTLADERRALEFLRRELLHVSDMLDPAFGYEPRLPRSPTGPPEDRLVRDRYAVLWNCSVDGRLAGSGRLGGEARLRRLAEFAQAFACLGDSVATCFERIFTGPRPIHSVLVALASDPESAFGMSRAGHRIARRCPLCAFPAAALEPAPDRLPESVAGAIRSEFPSWTPARGICRQCADLYRARSAGGGCGVPPAVREVLKA